MVNWTSPFTDEEFAELERSAWTLPPLPPLPSDRMPSSRSPTPSSTRSSSSSPSPSPSPTPGNASRDDEFEALRNKVMVRSTSSSSSDRFKTTSFTPSPRSRSITSSSTSEFESTFENAERTVNTIMIVSVVFSLLFIGGIAIAVYVLYRRYARNQEKKRQWEAQIAQQARAGTHLTASASTASTHYVPFAVPAHHQHHLVHAASSASSPTMMAAPSAPTLTHSHSLPLAPAPAPRQPESSRTTTSSPHTSGGLWDDPVIIAARIPLDRLTVNHVLSRGGYGEVYQGVYKGEQVAIKKLLPEKRRDLIQINEFLVEIKLMASLEHAHIVRFIGVGWDALSDLCVVSEFMSSGDLRTLLQQWNSTGARPQGLDADKARIALHVVFALTYLHSLTPKIVHRDLKSKNILLDEDWNAKVMDFGVSRERSDATMTAAVGTSLWMAPEVLLGERYDEKADMFSFGVVLSELDSHQLPYAQAKAASSDSGRSMPDTAILQLVSLGRLRVELSDQAPAAVRTLVDACVDLDPQKRPTAAEALYQMQLIARTYS